MAKAIRDGGVDAVLDHEQSCMRSKDTPDVYATAEPAGAFHARVAFCLDIHNEARRPIRTAPGTACVCYWIAKACLGRARVCACAPRHSIRKGGSTLRKSAALPSLPHHRPPPWGHTLRLSMHCM